MNRDEINKLIGVGIIIVISFMIFGAVTLLIKVSSWWMGW